MKTVLTTVALTFVLSAQYTHAFPRTGFEDEPANKCAQNNQQTTQTQSVTEDIIIEEIAGNEASEQLKPIPDNTQEVPIQPSKSGWSWSPLSWFSKKETKESRQEVKPQKVEDKPYEHAREDDLQSLESEDESAFEEKTEEKRFHQRSDSSLDEAQEGWSERDFNQERNKLDEATVEIKFENDSDEASFEDLELPDHNFLTESITRQPEAKVEQTAEEIAEEMIQENTQEEEKIIQQEYSLNEEALDRRVTIEIDPADGLSFPQETQILCQAVMHELPQAPNNRSIICVKKKKKKTTATQRYYNFKGTSGKHGKRSFNPSRVLPFMPFGGSFPAP